MPIVRRAYLLAACAWAALLPVGPFVVTRVHASTMTHAFALAIYATGAVVCHQRPERSFHLWGARLPVCARCTGIYVGAALAALAMARRLSTVVRAFQVSDAPRGRWRPAENLALRVFVLASLPTLATLIFEWTTGVMPSNPVRFAAGLPLGAVVSWIVLNPSTSLGVDRRAPKVE